MDLKKELQKKEEQAKTLAGKYNQVQQDLKTLPTEMVKLEGAINQLKELIELEKEK